MRDGFVRGRWFLPTALVFGLIFLYGPIATLVVYSFMSRQPVQVRGADSVFRNIAVHGFWLYSPPFRGSPKIADALKSGARLIAEGNLKVPVAARYPLTKPSAALGHALDGGKVLFQISPQPG